MNDYIIMQEKLKSSWNSAFGVDLEEGNYSEEELRKLQKLADGQGRQCPQELVHIPLQSKVRQPDPRLVDLNYRKAVVRNNIFREVRNKYLEKKNLDVIIDLDWTIAHAIPKFTYVSNEVPPIHLEIKELKNKYKGLELHEIVTVHSSYIVALRPSLKNFLNRLKRFANLYVYAVCDPEYATQVIKKIDSERRLFASDPILIDQKKNKNYLKSMKPFRKALNKSNILIFEDNIDAWKSKYQDRIVLSKRFVPLYNEDPELNQLASDKKLYHYKYAPDLETFQDEFLSFVDTGQSQDLSQLALVFQRVYEKRFISFYKTATSDMIKNSNYTNISGSSFNLENIQNPDRKKTIAKLIALMKGKVSSEAVFCVCEDLEGHISTNEIIDIYFLPNLN